MNAISGKLSLGFVRLVILLYEMINYFRYFLRLRVTQKALQLPFSSQCFWTDCQKIFRQRFTISYQRSV